MIVGKEYSLVQDILYASSTEHKENWTIKTEKKGFVCREESIRSQEQH